MLWALFAVLIALARQQSPPVDPPPPAHPPIYTAAQAAAGLAAYTARCAACHLEDLGGNGDAPALTGADFVGRWSKKSPRELLQYLKGMPPGGPALNESDYVAIAAYLLQENGAAAGGIALEASNETPIGAVANGRRPAR